MTVPVRACKTDVRAAKTSQVGDAGNRRRRRRGGGRVTIPCVADGPCVVETPTALQPPADPWTPHSAPTSQIKVKNVPLAKNTPSSWLCSIWLTQASASSWGRMPNAGMSRAKPRTDDSQ